MSEREERVARNESIARNINEGIEEAKASTSSEGYIRMLCECGGAECDRLVAITVGEYEDVRRDPRRFAVVADHIVPDVELVVSRTERFTVVQKREGPPAEVAKELDPRD
jgi:hypothetical protein